MRMYWNGKGEKNPAETPREVNDLKMKPMQEGKSCIILGQGENVALELTNQQEKCNTGVFFASKEITVIWTSHNKIMTHTAIAIPVITLTIRVID